MRSVDSRASNNGRSPCETSDSGRVGRLDRVDWWLALSIGLFTLILLGGVKQHRFSLDSPRFLLHDERIREGRYLEIWGSDYWNLGADRSLVADQPSLYRPVALTWLALGYSWTRPRDLASEVSPPINLGNLLFHVGASVLRVILLLAWLPRRPERRFIALAIGLLLAVHPVGSETIGTQVGASEGLGALLVAGAMVLALEGGLPRGIFQGVLTYLAILSKENAVVLPAMVFAQAWLASGLAWRDATRRALPAILATGIALLQRYWVLGTLTGVSDPVMAGFPWSARVMTGLAVFASYTLPSIFWPSRLHPNVTFGDLAPAQTWGDPRVLVGGVVLVLASVVAFRARRRRPLVTLGLILFSLPWILVSHLVVPIGAVAATRFAYLPLFGVGVVLADLLASAALTSPLAIWGRRLALAAVVLTTVALGRSEIQRWRSDESLLESALLHYPRSGFLNYNLGTRKAEGVARESRPGADLSKAIGHFRSACEAEIPEIPGRPGVHPEDLLELRFQAASNLGIACARTAMDPTLSGAAKLDRANEAKRALEAARETAERGLVQSLSLAGQTQWQNLVTDARINEARLRIGLLPLWGSSAGTERASALALLAQAERDDPDSVGIVLVRASISAQEGNSADAIRRLRAGLERHRPEFAKQSRVREMAVELARLLHASGQTEEATSLQLEALLADPPPRNPKLLYDLGWALRGHATARVSALAREALRQWLTKPDPGDPRRVPEVQGYLSRFKD